MKREGKQAEQNKRKGSEEGSCVCVCVCVEVNGYSTVRGGGVPCMALVHKRG